MNIFVLLAGLAFLVVGAATLVALAVVAFGMRRRPLRSTALRICFCFLPMVCLVLLCWWVFGPVDYTNPQDLTEAYRSEFGSNPPSDVTDSHVHVVVVGDAWAAWHRFQAANTTIDSLVAKFEPTDQQSFRNATGGGNMPGWWSPDASGVDAYYVAHHWHGKDGYSEAYMGVNRTKGVIYFYHGES